MFKEQLKLSSEKVRLRIYLQKHVCYRRSVYFCIKWLSFDINLLENNNLSKKKEKNYQIIKKTTTTICVFLEESV